MKKQLQVILGIIVLVCMLGVLVRANSDTATQEISLNVEKMAVISLYNSQDIILTLEAPVDGGHLPTEVINTDTNIAYTSVVENNNMRNITAILDVNSNIPNGTNLWLEAINVELEEGQASNAFILSTSASNLLITDIASVATGEDGPSLKYTFEVDDMNDLEFTENATVTVIFTLTDDS